MFSSEIGSNRRPITTLTLGLQSKLRHEKKSGWGKCIRTKHTPKKFQHTLGFGVQNNVWGPNLVQMMPYLDYLKGHVKSISTMGPYSQFGYLKHKLNYQINGWELYC
jgi:hypothetical protein